ncbi:DNA (cytosine-5)-methyltransferase 1 [Caulobacter rhizosphaerae]|uniref:DNA (cytosine-5-)-methyltransferase n=1 Tax=Caulobacter rhizosphaerae TaxID=2010972 RepID=A0ABU1MVP2_9CAUL|nr:DNA cytosine methyltransferase [Caulobacter rhizosphaerae]MDR6530258.1 DNA (cytosine-5)-methyltransferase 1 [Caulobacter rhizosphaerae]
MSTDSQTAPDPLPGSSPGTTAIDLFCGAGGLAYGLKSAGLRVVAGVDLDPSCKFPLEKNTGAVFKQRDVTDLTTEDLVEWFGDAPRRVLAGCAPCQPFSTYSQSRKSKDDRWMLLREFKRLALAVKPDVVTMENVAGLAKQDVWTEFTDALRGAGYKVWAREVNCVDYGVPQARKRLVMLASLLGPIELEKPEPIETDVFSAIGHLDPIPAGAAALDDPLHSASSLSDINLERIQKSRPGGTWRDWPESLRAACHRRPTGKTYPSVYGRMEWKKPSPTITTQCYGFGNGRFGHPDQDRAITLREAAILQSFPKEYQFLRKGEVVSFTRLGTLIGNAVPPKLGEAIGQSIQRHLAMHPVIEQLQ